MFFCPQSGLYRRQKSRRGRPVLRTHEQGRAANDAWRARTEGDRADIFEQCLAAQMSRRSVVAMYGSVAGREYRMQS